MVKVVYNNGYGGFDLSKRAVSYLLMLGADPSKVGVDGDITFCNLPRHDLRLVLTVELLGKSASGPTGNLEVTTVKRRYFIDSIEGWEKVVTPKSLKRVWVKP